MQLEKMTKDEKSLLLYLETRVVDYGGRVNTIHMNRDDMKIAEKWNKSKFVRFGRIVMRHHNSDGTHWCILSDEAWKLVHQERKNRHARLWLSKNWLSTEDNSKVYGHPHFSGMNESINFLDNQLKAESDVGTIKKSTRKL